MTILYNMDNLVYEESINTEVNNSEFVSKKWIYANDNNSQNYSSQVILDTTALSNSGAYIMWAEAFIIMPLIVCLSAYNTTDSTIVDLSSVNSTAKYVDQSWTFKSGFMNIVHSATIEYNNSNVCQQTPLVNVFKNFEILTSWSQDNLKNDSPSTGYYPDSSDTFGVAKDATNQVPYSGLNGSNTPQLFNNCVGVYQNATNASLALHPTGNGLNATLNAGVLTYTDTTQTITTIQANSITLSGASTLASRYINEGVSIRNAQMAEDVLSNSSYSVVLGQDSIYDNSTLQTNWINQRTNPTTTSVAEWFVYAKLYLKNFADIFQKTPLLKGSTLRFYINTNQCISEFNVNTGTVDGSTTGANAPFITAGSTVITNNGGSTNPLMITNLMPLAIRTATGANSKVVAVKLSLSIYQNRWSQQGSFPNGTAIAWSSSPLQSCRLYAPAYKFTSLAEQKYLSLAPTKTIEYNDVFQYQFQNISGNSDFNILVSNGLQGIQSVLVIPFLQNDSANGVIQKTSYSTLLSPYTTSGSTPDPVPLTNFNILVSGVNLFLDNEQYDFQQFQQELKSSNQLNGNLTDGLTSGLINEKDFNGLYRYYYGNCKRILPAEEDVSRSVQIRGKVNLPSSASAQNIMLMVFVQFKRKITIDIQTGARID